jgi:SAM-dependent methyltransferase
MSLKARIWDRMYRGTPSWELGQPDPVLVRALDDRRVQGPGRALDVGCGTGDNAIELAARGFEVTAIDIADRPLAMAREKAAAAGVTVEFRRADVTRLGQLGGAFDLVVDRGLLMSLFGERARGPYASALIRLTAEGGSHYQYQWELPRDPRLLSAGWWASKVKGFVTSPGEIEDRFGDAFVVEQLYRSIEPTDDPGIRRMGIRQVAKTSYWLQRRPFAATE